MYTLMSNKQYYDAICSGTISNTEGINSECRGAVWGGFGDQNPSGIHRRDPTHACKHACPRASVPPCAVTCVPVRTRVPQAW